MLRSSGDRRNGRQLLCRRHNRGICDKHPSGWQVLPQLAAHAAQGTEITLTATPDEGYRLKEWQVVKGGVTITNNKFTMPAAEVEVKAVFEEIPCEGSSCDTPTISARSQQPIGIHAAAGAITLTNLPSGARVEVYGLNGKQMYSGRALQSAPLRIAVPAKSVYIVRAGSQSLKAAVR